MADRELRIRVGAAIDASFTTVFASVMNTVKRARQQIEREMVSGAKAGAAAHRSAGKETEKIFMDEAKAAKSMADMMTKDVAKSARERVKEERAAAREVEQIQKQMTREFKREAVERAKEDAKAAKERAKFFTTGKAGGMALRAGGAAFGATRRVATDALRGLGVETSLGERLGGAVERQSLAQTISNNALIGSGKGPPGSATQVNPKELLNQANETANATGFATKDILEGTREFVALTGDLQTARSVMTSIGEIAKANGAEFDDMMKSTAAISNAMGDIPNKGEQLAAVMRTVAGQGQLSAIEIKDMAKNMGYLTARANYFKIDPMSAQTLSSAGVTNETGQRVAVAGALAQYARQKGGRISARLATRSSMAFLQDLANPNEVKRMEGAGINPYADAGHTQVRDPLQMILEIFRKGQGKGGVNLDVINKLVPNQQARAVVNAIGQDYNKAYAESKATTETERHREAMMKVTENFQDMLRVTQSTTEVQQKFQDQMGTMKTKVQVLNNHLGKSAEELADKLLPAIIALTPAFVAATVGIADFIADITGQKKTADMKSGHAADTRAFNAATMVHRAVEEAGDINEFAGMKGPLAYHHGKISQADLDEAKAAQDALKTEIAKKEDALRKDYSPGMRAQSDEELKKYAASGGLGAEKHEQLIQDKKALEGMKATFEKMSTDLDKLDVLSRVMKGDAMAVVITKDETKGATPPGAQPKTNGVTPVDSGDNSSHE